MKAFDIIYFLLLVGPLIFVHELGHFIFAKAFKVKVLKFSLGFGARIFGFKWGETEYQITWFPLGGFVKMLGEDPKDYISEDDHKRAFSNQPAWKKSLIVFAGPAMSLIFPLFIYFGAFLSIDQIMPSTVGVVLPDSPAEKAGLIPGDKILEVNGRKVYGFDDLLNEVNPNPGKQLTFLIERNKKRITKNITPRLGKNYYPFDIVEEVGQIGIISAFPSPIIGIEDENSPAYKAGLRTSDKIIALNNKEIKNWYSFEQLLSTLTPDKNIKIVVLRPKKLSITTGDFNFYNPEEFNFMPQVVNGKIYTGIESGEMYISYVKTGSPSEKAGIKAGDKIIEWNDKKILSWDILESSRRGEPNKFHKIKVSRNGQILAFKIKQNLKKRVDEYGQELQYYELGIKNFMTYEPPELVKNPNRIVRAITSAWSSVVEVTRFMFLGFYLLLSGKVSLNTMGGPLMIFDLAGSAGREGTFSFLWMMALISLNLGILNLFPIPLLDGGHLFIFLIEAIRRKPLSLKSREVVSMIGLVFLISLMILVFSNDIQRYVDWGKLKSWFQ